MSISELIETLVKIQDSIENDEEVYLYDEKAEKAMDIKDISSEYSGIFICGK